MSALNHPREPHGTVLVSETGVEPHQLIGRSGESVFPMGGAIHHGGLKSGPGPFDLMASALGACTAMTIRAYAQRRGLKIDRVQVNVVHMRPSLDSQDVFERTIHIDGDLAPEVRETLLQVADLCPVGKTLSRGSRITTAITPDLASASAYPPLSDYVQTLEQVWQHVP
jgi:putative redox protein